MITAVVEAIVAESVERMELPAAPPTVRHADRPRATRVIARMDGSPFPRTVGARRRRVADARPVDADGHVAVAARG